MKAADLFSLGGESGDGQHRRRGVRGGKTQKAAVPDINQKIVFVEEIRTEDWLAHGGNLEGVLGLQGSKRKGNSPGAVTRNRCAVGRPKLGQLSGKRSLNVCCWIHRKVCSTVDEETATTNVIDNGEGARQGH